VLAPDFVYEGPIAGRRVGPESFVIGLGRFVNTLKAMRMLQQLHATASRPRSTTAISRRRLAPFASPNSCASKMGRVHEVKLVFDATQFR